MVGGQGHTPSFKMRCSQNLGGESRICEELVTSVVLLLEVTLHLSLHNCLFRYLTAQIKQSFTRQQSRLLCNKEGNKLTVRSKTTAKRRFKVYALRALSLIVVL